MFTIVSTCFEPEGSFSGRRLYVQVRYNSFDANSISRVVGGTVCLVLFHLQDCLYRWYVNKLYHTGTYNRLPKDEPSGSKHVEDIVKIKTLLYQRCILFVYIIRSYYNAPC